MVKFNGTLGYSNEYTGGAGGDPSPEVDAAWEKWAYGRSPTNVLIIFVLFLTECNMIQSSMPVFQTINSPNYLESIQMPQN